MMSLRLSVIALLLCVSFSDAALLKRRNLRAARAPTDADEEYTSSDSGDADDVEGESFDDVDYKPFQNPDTIKKYNGLESVAEVLFTIACKAKHKLDVKGAAKEKSKEAGWKMPQMIDYIKKVQGAQADDLKRSCGMLTGKSSQKCHEGCTARWAGAGAQSQPKQKQGCLNMCNIKHTNWETECIEQVDNLKQVYVVEQGQLTGASECINQHCPKFPQVTMINNDDKEAKLSEQQGIVDAGCDKMCTEDGIKATCERDFSLNVDFVMFELEEKCQGEEKPAMDTCMTDEQGTVDEDFDSCKRDGEGTCGDQAKDCMSEQGDTMSAEEGQKFCDEREKMCKEQVSKGCSEKNEKALKAATKKCKKDYDAGMKTCLADATAAQREKDVKKCVDETTPTCKDDCQDKCQLEDLDKCQADLSEAGRGVTKGFCEQFWQWIYDSELVDPKTGDVIPKSLAPTTGSEGADLLGDAE